MPVHGEYRHLYANKEIAEFMGIPSQNIFISELGRVLELDRKTAAFGGTVPAGRVLVDGSGVGDIGSVVLRERRHLAEDGLVVVVASVDLPSKYLISGPDIVTRGFVYVKESEELIESARKLTLRVLEDCCYENPRDWTAMKSRVREELSRMMFQKTKKSPMILPIIMDA